MNDELLEREIRATLRRAAPRSIPFSLELRATAIPDTVPVPSNRWLPLDLAAWRRLRGVAATAATALAIAALVALVLPFRTLAPSWERTGTISMSENETIVRVASGPGGLLVLGTAWSPSAQVARAWWSVDGRSWKRIDLFSTVGVDDASQLAVTSWGLGWVVVIGENVFTSTDGTSWKTSSLGSGARGRAVLTRNGSIIVAGEAQPPSNGDYQPEVWVLGPGETEWSMARIESATTEYGTFWGLADTGTALVAWGNVYEAQGTDVNAAPLSDAARLGGVPWTSTDGLSWRRVADTAPFDRAQIGQVVNGGHGLLALGRVGATATQSAAQLWSSADGSAWRPVGTMGLPFGALGDLRLRAGGGPGGLAVFVVPGYLPGGEYWPFGSLPVLPPGSPALWTSKAGDTWTAAAPGVFSGSSLIEVVPFRSGLAAVGAGSGEDCPGSGASLGSGGQTEAAATSAARTCGDAVVWLLAKVAR